MHILVVDDDRAVREALERALGLEGYEVELAADGAEALAAVELREPDVLIRQRPQPLHGFINVRPAGFHTLQEIP